MPKLFSKDFLATLQQANSNSSSSESDPLLEPSSTLWSSLENLDDTDLTNISEVLQALERDSETHPALKKIYYALIAECKKSDSTDIQQYAYATQNNIYHALRRQARYYLVPNCIGTTLLSPLSMILCCFHEQEGCKPGELGMMLCDTPSPYSGKDLVATILREKTTSRTSDSTFFSLFCSWSPRINCLKLSAFTEALENRIQENNEIITQQPRP